jgi:hypothetical protein
MPLKKGSGKDTVSSNIKTLVHDYERKGSIGNSKPASKKKAVKQAVAIALDKARESGKDPAPRRSKKSATAKTSAKRGAGRKSTARKSSTTTRKSTAKRGTTSRSTAAKSTRSSSSLSSSSE